MTSLGKKIRNLRNQSGLSQAGLAEALGYSAGTGQTTISSWERDRTEPTREDVQKIAYALGVDLWELEGHSDRLNRDHNSVKPDNVVKKYSDNKQKVNAVYLGLINHSLHVTPGGELMRVAVYDSGLLPDNVELFALDFEANTIGNGTPAGQVIGVLFTDSPPQSGDIVVVKMLEGEKARYTIARLLVDQSDRNIFFEMSDIAMSAPIIMAESPSEEIIGKVLEFRLRPIPVVGPWRKTRAIQSHQRLFRSEYA